MGRVELVEREIASMSADELAEFRRWFEAFDWDTWDREIEADSRAGRLDTIANAALTEFREGNTRPL
jgi:hypothetical protein